MKLAVVCLSVTMAMLPMLASAMPSCSMTFSENDLSFSTYVHEDDTFDVVGLHGTDPLTGPTGYPILPVERVYILIPQDRTCSSVNVTSLDTNTLAGSYYVFPCQLPELTDGSPPPPFTEPDSAAYNSGSLYPSGFATLVGEGFSSGYKLAEIEIHPLRYVAAERRLVFCSSMHISLTLTPCENQARPVYRRSELTQQHVEKAVRAMVVNPEDIDGYNLGFGFHVEGKSSPGKLTLTELPSVEGNPVDYVVITSAAMAGAFDSILDWRTRRGQVAALRTVEWIDAHYPGCDIQERIRNFIIDAHSNWGTNWVLLGGDKDVVPLRWTLPGQDLPSDLYYAELQGNWNRNRNAYFGDDTSDLVDKTLLPDVCLGRLPVWDTAQVRSFWNKLMSYEKAPDPDSNYIHGILMAGGSYSANKDDSGFPHADGEGAVLQDTWHDDYPRWGLQHRSWFDSCGFQKVYELYSPRADTQGAHNDTVWWSGDSELTSSSFIQQFNDVGYQFVNHMDHGSPTTLGTGLVLGGGYVTKPQASTFHNGVNHQGGSRYSILWTFGCSTGALDHASIGQTMINNPNGGCIAYVGSSRPGDFLTQWKQDHKFYEEIFPRGLTGIGEAFRYSQPLPGSDPWQLACTKMLNLYGDPAMPVWTDGPFTMAVSCDTPIQMGTQNYIVSTTCGSGAVVTLYKQNSGQVELYTYSETDGSGTATFSNLCPESPGIMLVTVTKQNFLPFEDSCEVVACSSAYLHYKAIVAVDDDSTGVSFGNGDSILNPGEHVELTIRIENTGEQTATGITGALATSDPFVEVLQSRDSFEDIDSGQTAKNITPFVFSVDSNRPVDSANPCEIAFAITIASDQDTWSDDFRIMLMRDSLVHGGHRLFVSQGGDSFIMDSLAITNYGWGAAAGCTVRLASNNPGYLVDDSVVVFPPNIPGESTSVSLDSFSFRKNPFVDSSPDFDLRMSDRYGRTWVLQHLDLVPPDGVYGLRLLLAGDHYLTIGWWKCNSSDLRGYNVYRRHDTTGAWHLANRMLVDTSATFRDQGLSPYTRYQYKVAAVDSSGNEGHASDSLTVRTTPTCQAGWPVHAASGHEQRTSGVCGNIVANESLEVVAVMGDSIYAWSCTGQRLSGWPKGLGMMPHSSPVLGDLNSDGYDEVVFGPSNGYGVSAWKGNGDLLWFVGESLTGSVAIADVDQDGSLDVVGATADGYINLWGATGALEDSWPIMNGSPFSVHGSPAVADLDPSSPGLEIVVIAMDLRPDTGLHYQPYVIAYRNDGTRLWDQGIWGADRSWGADCNSPVLYDLNGNGRLEIVAAVSGSDADDIWVLNDTGGYMCNLGDIESGGIRYGTWDCPAIGDITGDGKPEIVITASGPGYGGLHGTCVAAWETDVWGGLHRIGFYQGVDQYALSLRGGPTIADIDGDGLNDVITGYFHTIRCNDRIRAFDFVPHQGFVEDTSEGFPIYGIDLPYQQMFVTDLDLDGDLELLAFMSEQGVVHVWDFPVRGDRREVEWNGYHGDVRNTGLYAQPILGGTAHDANWWGRYKLWGDFVLSNHDLAVQPGTWVQARRWWTAAPRITIDSGKFTATGTRAAPTYFETEFAGDTWDGVRVSNGRASVVGCNIADASEGLAVTGCDSLLASHGSFTNYKIGGITCESTAVSSVESCQFTGAGNAIYGLYADGTPSPCSIVGNRFENSGQYGIWLESTLGPTIAGNSIRSTDWISQFGIRCYEIATTPQLGGSITGNSIKDFGQGGILCQASSPFIHGRNDLSDNGVFGLQCLDGAFPAVESSYLEDNYVGVMAANESYPDLGTDPPNVTVGYNSIVNWFYNVVNGNDMPAQSISAQNNWWGQTPPDTWMFVGSVIYEPYLGGRPGDGPQEKAVTPAFPLALGQNRPNPFSAATHIMLSNPRQQRLSVSIYDVSGRQVKTLFDAVAPPGRTSLSWNGLDARGRKVSSGVYFCRLTAGNEKKVSRVVYVRGK
jgi:parallel beta-helix repeat protein